MFTEPTAPAPTANTSTGWQSIFLRADGLRSGWRLAIFLLIFFPVSYTHQMCIRDS